MGILFPNYGSLVTGGAIGDGLFFFLFRFYSIYGKTRQFSELV